MWDRIDDAFDDERYGTIGELKSRIEKLEKELTERGIEIPAWTPPWDPAKGVTVEAERVALYGRKQQLQKLLDRNS